MGVVEGAATTTLPTCIYLTEYQMFVMMASSSYTSSAPTFTSQEFSAQTLSPNIWTLYSAGATVTISDPMTRMSRDL